MGYIGIISHLPSHLPTSRDIQVVERKKCMEHPFFRRQVKPDFLERFATPLVKVGRGKLRFQDQL